MPQLLFDGYTIDEVLDLSHAEFQAFVLAEETLAFKAGGDASPGKFSIAALALLAGLTS